MQVVNAFNAPLSWLRVLKYMEALSPKTRQASPGVIILLLVLLCLLLLLSSFLVLRLWRLSTRGTAARTGQVHGCLRCPALHGWARCGRVCARVSRVVAGKSESGGGS